MIQSHLAVCNPKNNNQISPKSFQSLFTSSFVTSSPSIGCTPPARCGGVCGHPAPGPITTYKTWGKQLQVSLTSADAAGVQHFWKTLLNTSVYTQDGNKGRKGSTTFVIQTHIIHQTMLLCFLRLCLSLNRIIWFFFRIFRHWSFLPTSSTRFILSPTSIEMKKIS